VRLSLQWWIDDSPTSETFPAYGEVEFKSGKTWSGRIELEYSEDQGETWDTLAVITSNQDSNTSLIREVYQSGTLLRVRVDNLTFGEVYFEAKVTDVAGNTNTTVFNGRVLADPDNVADVIPRDTGEFKFPVFGENEQVTVQLVNDQPWRCAFGSTEWTGSYRPKARRV